MDLNITHAKVQAFWAWWRKLDEQRVKAGKGLAGFEEAWEAYRVHLIELEAQERFLEHAAFGDRHDA